ncbi:MAG TPA: cysteine peptidase family C39 domain-containing protein [Sedimentisphaerales bacterium]|nr:cysteine peptidase family C39 domain-containing protein [Sedimentisphaerales bacterium]
MRTRVFVSAVLLLFVTNGYALADRPLSRTEIMQIFQTLTGQPRRAWIPSGVIHARHLEYKASTGYTTDTDVIVKYDGDRFYWEINLNSHTRESEPPANAAGPYLQDDFNPNWNKRRVSVWDGSRYTMYTEPVNNSIVTEGKGRFPVAVSGPLTASLVPWGYGAYTLEGLSACESSAVEVDVGGQKQINLTVFMDAADFRIKMVFALDPAKDYALLSWSQDNGGMASTLRTYQDYQLVSGKWIPRRITVELYNTRPQSPELLSYESWDLASVRIGSVDPASFRVNQKVGSRVDYYSPLTERPLSYHDSGTVDTDSLLQERLLAAANNSATQNCATLAIKYVAQRLGKDVTDANLAQLVSDPNKGTSLYALRQFARDLGFHCLAAKTDIQTLKNLQGGQAILHLPGPKHYVVLEHVDQEYAWFIDLDSNKFYYRTKLRDLDIDWGEGTALLISKQPLALTGTFAALSDSDLHKITGGFPNYSCTKLIQHCYTIYCSEMMWGVCDCVYREFCNLWGCQEDQYGAACYGELLPAVGAFPCIEDIYWPGMCTTGAAEYWHYRHACASDCEPE